MAALPSAEMRRTWSGLWPLALVPIASAGALALERPELAVLSCLGLLFLTAFLRLRRPRPGPGRDPETGLILRDTLENRLDDMSSPGVEGRAAAKACLVLELDAMDQFRQQWGADAADTVLRISVDRLDQVLRQSDRLARLGPYRIGLAIPFGLRVSLDTCLALAERCQSALAEPIAISGTTAQIDSCAGLALRSSFPQATGPRLLAAAEAALEQAQAAGPGSLRMYSPVPPKAQPDRPALADAVRHALDHNEITAAFQPQASMTDGRVLGFEALARWTTPDLRSTTPAEFLPAVQASGLAFRLTEAMLVEALRALKAFSDAGYGACTVSMNLSLSDLHDPHLAAKVATDLDRFGIAPARLRFEVTEDVLTPADHGQLRRSLAGLADIGCCIDLDGFGCDGGTISNLRGLPIDRIKIARQIVAGIDRDAENRDLMSAILSLAQTLRIETLAMGVETMGEYVLLRDMGCQAMQGFGLAHPAPLDAALTWMDQRARPNKASASNSGFMPQSLARQST